MLKLGKLTDYAFVLLTRFVKADRNACHTARDLADETGLPLPTVSKILKIFGRGGLLKAHRGAHGGYCLSRDASDITVSEILEIIDGPIAITDCVCEHQTAELACAIEDQCNMKQHWITISNTIRDALNRITLEQLALPSLPGAMGMPLNISIPCSNHGKCHENRQSHQPCTCGEHELNRSGESQ